MPWRLRLRLRRRFVGRWGRRRFPPHLRRRGRKRALACGKAAAGRPKRLVVKDLEVGEGRAVKPGDELEVYFTSFHYLTGKHFETIWKPAKPFDFKLNRNEVIPGWVKGLPGMKVGGRRYLEVPGQQAARGGISPFQDPDDSALVYMVELLEVK